MSGEKHGDEPTHISETLGRIEKSLKVDKEELDKRAVDTAFDAQAQAMNWYKDAREAIAPDAAGRMGNPKDPRGRKNRMKDLAQAREALDAADARLVDLTNDTPNRDNI